MHCLLLLPVFLPLLPENSVARDYCFCLSFPVCSLLWDTLNLCCFGCTVLCRGTVGAFQLVGEEKLEEMSSTELEEIFAASLSRVSNLACGDMKEAKVSSHTLERDENWKCRRPHRAGNQLIEKSIVPECYLQEVGFIAAADLERGTQGLQEGIWTVSISVCSSPFLKNLVSYLSHLSLNNSGTKRQKSLRYHFMNLIQPLCSSTLFLLFLCLLFLFSHPPVSLRCRQLLLLIEACA